MVRRKGDLDEISDKTRDTTIEVLQQYMQTLGSVEKDLHELQIQENRIQVDVGKASGAQAIMKQGSNVVIEIEWTLDL